MRTGPGPSQASPAVADFARSAVTTSMAHGFLFGLTLLTSVLAARLLGPEGKGVYALVLLFASIFVFFTSFGLHHAAAYFLGRNDPAPREVFGHALISLATVLVVAVSAALVAGPLLGGTIFPSVAPGVLMLGIPLIVCQHAFGFLTLVLLGRNDIGAYNLAQIVRGALLLLIAVPVLFLGYGVQGIVGAESAAFLFAAVLAFVLALRKIGGFSIRLNPVYARTAFRYGLTVYSGHALSFFHYRTALMLLSALASPAVVGLYSVAAGVAGNLSLISQGAATALFPRISADPEAVHSRDLTPVVLRTVVIMAGAAAVVLGLAGPWLIVLIFGAAFAGSVAALQVLLPGAVALCAWSILDSYFKGAGRPVWSTLTTGLAVVAGAGLNIWWIRPYGLLGASAATSVAYVISLTVALAAFTRLSGIPLGAVLLPRRTDLSLYRAVLSRLVRPHDLHAGTPQEVTGGTPL